MRVAAARGGAGRGRPRRVPARPGPAAVRRRRRSRSRVPAAEPGQEDEPGERRQRDERRAEREPRPGRGTGAGTTETGTTGTGTAGAAVLTPRSVPPNAEPGTPAAAAREAAGKRRRKERQRKRRREEGQPAGTGGLPDPEASPEEHPAPEAAGGRLLAPEASAVGHPAPEAAGKRRRKERQRKRCREEGQPAGTGGLPDTEASPGGHRAPEAAGKRRRKKRRRADGLPAGTGGQPAPEAAPGGCPSPEAAGGSRSAALRARMAERLLGARFRFLNQQLYTSSSRDAARLFRDDPEAFRVYHRGFARQVARWPQHPVQRVIRYLRSRPASLVVADFGCGDCKVAASVRNTVHSFDLVPLSPRVTVCDMAQVPLAAESVDVAVFCLALMGTNLQEILEEANRVLKMGGTLLVAEVASRFGDMRSFLGAMAQLGFRSVSKDLSSSFFHLLEFRKAGPPPARPVPGLRLRPCLYKRR